MSKELEAAFRSRGVLQGNTLLLQPTVALEFIADCRQRSIRVLGIDGFRLLSKNQIRPIIEDSIDLSSLRFGSISLEEAFAHAETFIRERIHNDALFEVVTD